MFKEKIILLSALVLLSSLIAGLPTGHAGGYPSGFGTVCLVDESVVGTNLAPPGPCAETGATYPYTFNAPYPSSPQPGPTQIRVGVYVNGSDSIGGFTVILNATHTVLKAVDVDLTNSLLVTASGPPQIFAECLDGVKVKGPACSGADGLDTLDLSAGVALGGSNTAAPSSGLLFTAIFNVSAAAPSGGIPIAFQQSNQYCSSSSTANEGQGNYCVSITKPPSTIAIPEVVQTGAVFDNSGCPSTCNLPWVAVGSNVTSITVIQNAVTGTGVNITATPENGWPGSSTDSITFTSVVTTSSTASFSPPFTGTKTCSPKGTGGPACPITISVQTGTAGTYTVTIYGTYVSLEPSGVSVTLVGTVSIIVNIGSVSWTINNVASTSTQTIYMAKGASNPLDLQFTATSLGGYSGTVTYSTGVGGVGLTIVYPPTFTIASYQTVTRLVNITATNYPANAIAYKAKLTASGLAVQTSAIISFHVAGVSMSTNATSVSFVSETNAHVMVTLSSLPATTEGFAGTVNLATSVTGPTGFGHLGVSCPSMVLAAGGTNSGTCTFSGSLAGSYTATIGFATGTNGAITNSTTVSAVISPGSFAGINMDANSTSFILNVNTAHNATITLTSRNGFSGMVTVAVTTTGTICSLNTTTPISVTSNAHVRLSCMDSSAETVNATVTATSSSSIINATTVLYMFQDFSNTPSPSSVTANTGVAGTSTITISSKNGFTGTVSLVATTNSTNLSCNLSSMSITGGSGTSTLSCTGSAIGNYRAKVSATSSMLVHNSTIIFLVDNFNVTANPTSVTANMGVAGQSTITVAPVNSFSGTVTLGEATNSTNLSCSLTVTTITGSAGTSTLSCTGSVVGNYYANVTGTSGTASVVVRVTFHITALPPNFTIVASSTSVTANAGATATSTITIAPTNGFTSTVTLSPTTNSTSLVCTLSSSSITGGSGTSTLSCHGSPAGNYLATVTGASGSLTHSATVTFHAQDYTVIAGPTSVTANAGVAGTSTITVAPVNGFTGTVSLAVAANSTNLSCTLSAASITGGSGTSTLSCSSSNGGNYLATATGTSGSLSHSATVTYQVQDFTVTANPTSSSPNAGASSTSTITVASVNGFSGTVTLTVTTNSTSLSCTLSAASISGASGTSTLTCSDSTAGAYLATVTGASGSLSHTATVVFNVQGSSSGTILGLSPPVFYSVIGVVIAVVVIASLLLLRRRRGTMPAAAPVKKR